jgi:hypothetical protein
MNHQYQLADTQPREPTEDKNRIIRNFGKPIALLDNCFNVCFFFLGLFFDPEDGGDMLLQNVS